MEETRRSGYGVVRRWVAGDMVLGGMGSGWLVIFSVLWVERVQRLMKKR